MQILVHVNTNNMIKPKSLSCLYVNMQSRRGMFPRVFGDEFGDEFGDKFSELANFVIILVMNLVNCQIR